VKIKQVGNKSYVIDETPSLPKWALPEGVDNPPKQGTKPGQNMEKVPDKMSEAEHSKKVKELMNLAKSLYGEEKAIQCIKEYLTLGNYAKTDKIPEDKLKHFESFIDMFDTHLPSDL
jgi:hypothetical protein